MSNKNNTATEVLRERMVDRFGSIRQFAIQTKIERTQIYPILRGEALPGLKNFVTMAGALGLELDELADILGVDPRKEATP
jgi:DNA-binding phage protein